MVYSFNTHQSSFHLKYCIYFSRLPVRPTEEQLAMMRKARMKERKMFFLLQEIIVHLVFTTVVVLVTYGHKDFRSLYLYRNIENGLGKMTDKVCTLNCMYIAIQVNKTMRSSSPEVENTQSFAKQCNCKDKTKF